MFHNMLLCLCKNCSHKKDEHEKGKCSHNLVRYGRSCSCKEYKEMKITDRHALSQEFDEAWSEHNKFVASTKNAEGVYIIKDFAKAVLLQERQENLWKELTGT